ncbi:MAG: DNA cytosine methyltransferase [Terrimicrobiaceae bacterium]|nr:DNA cytosine methyltransferase [Terrimicrobiaceae bacterium]
MNLLETYPADFLSSIAIDDSKSATRQSIFRKKRAGVEVLPTISLFSGGGGLDLGLESAGFDVRFSTDIDPYSMATLQWGKEEAHKLGKSILRNTVVHRESVNDLDPSFILEAARLKKGDVAVLAGGPPCQAFSIFGKRKGLADKRGQLVFEYLRVLSKIEPETFVFENVYGLLTVEGGCIFQQICQHLQEPKKGLKYTISAFRLNAAAYGVPQFRDRIFIVGSRTGKKIEGIPAITGPSLLPYRTVGDAFRGLPKIGASFPANHTGRNHSSGIIDRYSLMSAGERDSLTRINKLDLTRPSYTIIVGSDVGGGKGHIHPTEAREVTPRESARIQTFPDWWGFAGKVRHPIRQVGNAVPPILGSAVANAIRENILGISAIPFRDVLRTLSQEHLFQNELDKI